MTKNAGSTKPGKAYRVHYNDKFGNRKDRLVQRPQVINEYFETSNLIDVHNQYRQHELMLEQLWGTTNSWFRLNTTVIGMNSTDCFLALAHGLPDSHSMKGMTMRQYNARLSNEFFEMSKVCSSDINRGDNIPLPRHVNAIDSSIPAVLDPQVISPRSELTSISTVEEATGYTVTCPPVDEEAPLVPEHIRSNYKFVRPSKLRRYCKAKSCKGKVQDQCLKCSNFYCNGEATSMATTLLGTIAITVMFAAILLVMYKSCLGMQN